MKLHEKLAMYGLVTVSTFLIGNFLNYDKRYNLNINVELRKKDSQEYLPDKTDAENNTHNSKDTLESNIEDSYIMAYADVDGDEYKIPISFLEYFSFRRRNHRVNSVDEYINFITYDNKTIKRIAESLTEKSKTKEESAQIILDFVHTIFYDVSIEENRDYVRYPIETIVEKNGDCEDLSILGVALMKSIGIDAGLVQIDKKGNGHVAIVVNGNFQGAYYNVNGKKYFYAEATSPELLSQRSGWEIGEIPKENKDLTANIHTFK